MNDLDDLEADDFVDNEDVDGTPEPYHAEVSTSTVNVTALGDEYDYDVETNLNSFFWDELLPTLIVYSLTFILGLVGNILIIFTTFRYRKMKSTTNVFLASLASADLLLIAFCIPVKEAVDEGKDDTKGRGEVCESPRSCKEVSKQLALNKLREILDELVTDDCANAEATKLESGDQNIGDVSNRGILMNILGKDMSETCELEDLMLKLKAALNDCSDLIQPEEEKGECEKPQGLFDEENEFVEEGAGFNLPTVIAFPVSTRGNAHSSRRSRNDEMGVFAAAGSDTSTDTYEDTIHRGNKRMALAHDVEESGGRADDSPEEEGSLVRKLKVKKSRRKRSKEEDSMSGNTTDEAPLENKSGKSGKSMRSGKSSKPEKSWSERSNGTSASGSARNSSRRTSRGQSVQEHSAQRPTWQRSSAQRLSASHNRAHVNLESTKVVEKRIIKLECRLKELLRRIGVYPNREQASIKRCLERLKETSEALLTRLRTNRSECCKCETGNSDYSRGEDVAHRGYQSEPESTIQVNKREKSVILRTSNSEIQLNVGMEITMENFDADTGEKLRPEENRDFEQEGNIQCKLVKPGEKPVTFIDTDFLYNPRTGMLFKGGGMSSKGHKNEDLPLKPTKTYLLSKTYERSLPPGVYSEKVTKGRPNIKEAYRRDKSSEEFGSSAESKHRERVTSPAATHADAFRLAVERQEMRNVRYYEECDSKGGSAARARACAGSARKPSLIPTAKFALRPGGLGVGAGCARPTEKRTLEQTYHLKEIQLAKLFSYTWTFGFFICKLVYYMQSVSAICSVLTLTAMSVERYYAIVHPMRAQYVCTISQARRIISVTWISSFFLAIPVLFAQIHMPVGVRVKGFWCVRDYDNPTIWRAHETYMLLLILVIPTGVMGVAYTTICLEIWQVMQRRQDLTSAKILNIRYTKSTVNSDGFSTLGREKKKQHRKTFAECGDDEAHVKQVIKMLVAVVVIYVVCWAPLLIDNILQAYDILPFMKFGKQKYMATAFHLMAYFNSCINPIVYGFMSKNFRESFHKTLCCHTRKGTASIRNPSVSHDRNTSIRYAESRSHQGMTLKSNNNGLREQITLTHCSRHGWPEERHLQ